MPIYSIQGPDGKTYSIEGPAGATRDQVIQKIQEQLSQQAMPEKAPAAPSTLRDVAIAGGQGALGAVKSISDVFGADNVVSEKLGAASQGLQGMYTPERQKELQYYQRLEEEAAKTGKPMDEVAAALKGIKAAPLQTTVQALGSLIPNLASLFIPVVGEAKGAALARNAYNMAVGIAEGTGAVKGSIYDGVKDELIKSGVKPEVAAAQASKAQEYLGENMGMIATGAGIGAAAGKFGAEQLLSPATKGVARKGVAIAGEAGTEAIQASQEQTAKNIALQKEGFDVPTFQGVAGAATKEGIMGGLGGGAIAPFTGRPPASQVPDAQPITNAQVPLLLEGKGAFVPVGLPDGSVAMTREDLAAYEEEQFRKKYEPQDVVREKPLLEYQRFPFTPVGLPDGSVATTREDLARYEEEQFQKKFAPQPVERPEETPVEEQPAAKPTDAGLSYGTATQEIEQLKRMPKSPETQARMDELQQFKMDMVADEIRRSQRELDPELIALRKQMEAQSVPYETKQKWIDQALADFYTSKTGFKGLENKPAVQTEEQAAQAKEASSLEEEAKKIASELKKLNTQKASEALKDELRGKLAVKEVIGEIGAEKEFRYLASKKGGGSSIAQMVGNGLLDKYLPADLRHTAATFDAQKAEEAIKERLRNQDYALQDAEESSRILGEQLGQLHGKINELSGSKNLQELQAKVPLEQRQEEAAAGAEEAFREAPKYMQATPGQQGIAQADVQSAADDITAGWSNAPAVETVQRVGDLPDNLQQQIARDKANPRGLYDPTTKKVWLVADNIGSKAEAAITLAHEALGHFGLRAALGTKFAAMMNDVYAGNKDVKERADKYIAEGMDKTTAVEEVLSEMAQDALDGVKTKQNISILRKVMNAIRQFLARLGMPINTITDNQVLELIANARKAVVEGAAPVAAEKGQAKYSQKNVPNRTPIGQVAMDLLGDMGRGVKPPPPGYVDRVRGAWDNARDNPQGTAKSAKAAFQKFMDWFETKVFSSNAALNNDIQRAITASNRGIEEKIGYMLETSLSQTVHADAIANLLLMDGKISYDKDTHKWKSEKVKDNLVSLAKQLDKIAEKYGLTKEEAQLIGHTAFEAKRLKSLDARNKEIPGKVAQMMSEADALQAAGQNYNAEQLRNKAREYAKSDKFIHMTDDQIASGMKLFDAMPELKDMVETWQGMRKNTMDAIVQGGLWSREEADDLLNNIDYVPFFREEQIEAGGGPREFIRGLQVRAKDPAMKGSEKPVNDVFDNMARWMQYAVNRSVRNRSAIALADAAVENNLGRKVDAPVRGENNANVWRDGKQEHYVMDDPLYMDAFKGLEAIAIPSIKFFSKMSDILRQSVVMYPLFSLAQVPQDSFAAMFSSGLKPRFALRIPALAAKEFIQSLRKQSKTHETLREFGAVGVRDFSSSTARMDAEISAGLKAPPGVLGKVKSSLGHIAMAADNAVRQAVYEASQAQGLSQAESLEKAFQLINFRARGSSKALALAGQVIPFFNAYLAAQHVMFKTITGKGISPQDREEAMKTLAATTASVMALSLMYAMMNGDDEDYINKPAAVRDRLLMIPGTGLSIPLRMDLFTIPKVITEHTYLMMTDKGYEDSRKFRDSMSHAFANAILSPTVVPQAIKPILEVGINYDFFQGRPLIGTYQKGLETERQFNDSTSELAKVLGSTGLVSPIAADHLIRGMFGSVGGLVTYMTNPLLHSDPDVPRPEMSLRDAMAALPGTSGFITRENENALKGDFYVLRDEVTTVANTINDMKARSPTQLDKYLEDETVQERLGLSKGVNEITQELTKIRRAISYITNAPEEEYSAAEKREEIKTLKDAEREMLKEIDIKALRAQARL
jgi:hypothetical protein